MIHGHGDDLYRYPKVWANFSSNVYAEADNSQLIAHLQDALPRIALSYPEPEPTALQRELADSLGYLPEQVLVTSGATEAIYLVAQLFSGAKTHILQPTFSEYADACRLHIHEFVASPEEAELLWCCNPNNPTGRVQAERRCNEHQVVVLDRSYQYFTHRKLRRPSIQDLEREQDLYIHSLTKQYRIPGLRLGYIIGAKHWIERLRSLRLPWSVNALAIEAGRWIIHHNFPETIDRPRMWQDAKGLAEAIALMKGYEVEETDTHFMLIKTPYPAHQLKTYLAEAHGLLIRDASNFEGLSELHIRIASQSREANNALILALKAYNGV